MAGRQGQGRKTGTGQEGLAEYEGSDRAGRLIRDRKIGDRAGRLRQSTKEKQGRKTGTGQEG